MKKYLQLIVLAVVLAAVSMDQQAVAQITAGTTAKTFQSVNPLNPLYAYQGKTENDMKFVQFSELFTLSSVQGGSREGGIYATNVGANGLVTVSMYLYDETSPDGKGSKIWGCYSDRNSTSATDFVHKAHQLTITDKLTQTPVSIDETDIVRILQVSDAYKTGTCSEWVTTTESIRPNMLMSGLYGAYRVCSDVIQKDYIWGTLACIFGGEVVGFIQGDDTPTKKEITTKQDVDCASRYLGLRNVIIELTVQNATVNAVKVPILGQIDLNQTFPTLSDFKLEIQVNGVNVVSVANTALNNNDEIIAQIPNNLTMGDEVTIKVTPLNVTTKPTIFGVPKVWVAPFAGDVQYQCNPNVQPGEYNPFIGYDSRVHSLMVIPYPTGFQQRVPDWTQTSNSNSTVTYSWSWTADRAMSSTITRYQPSLNWPKCHLSFTQDATTGQITYNLNECKNVGTAENPVYQRQNQKEGLNMEYLTYFSSWFINDFSSYDGATKYMFGNDDDELIYLNKQNALTTIYPPEEPCTSPNCQNTDGIVKMEGILPWKTMPEGKTEIYDPVTGFPKGGFALNEVIDAYRKAKWSQNGKVGKFTNYLGYEIQDQNTDWQHPDGNGSNVKHPGFFYVSLGGNKRVKVLLNVVSPLDKETVNGTERELGFYEALVGESNPTFGETGLHYWLRGVENKSDAELSKYTLEFTRLDKFGRPTSQTLSVKDIVTEKKTNSSWASWFSSKLSQYVYNVDLPTTTFNYEFPSYSWVTAYYQRTSTSQKVPVAGKELRPTYLQFMGIKSINGNTFVEGRGQGNKIFWEEFRNQPTGDYTVQRGNKYTRTYLREYTVSLNDVITFTAIDGDPYKFDNTDEEWYISNHAMARRISDHLLEGSYTQESGTGKFTFTSTPDMSKAYLKYYVKEINRDGTDKILAGETQPYIQQTTNGKDMTYTFNKTGYFFVKAQYRTSPTDILVVVHKINVVSYPVSKKGAITQRSLSPKEAAWLGLSNNDASQYRVYEIKDVLSKYKYEDGYRTYQHGSYSTKPNRWAKFNDYADTYSWVYLNDINQEVEFDTPLALLNYLSVYPSRQRLWMWHDWVLHFSSNWLSLKNAKGEQGLPPYVGERYVKRIASSSQASSFNDYLRDHVFVSTNPARNIGSWQAGLPLVSYTDYYGYRNRTNPKCIYQLSEVFDNQHGAFSGNPTLPETFSAPDYEDDEKEEQDFYYDLSNGRIMITKDTHYSPIKVYQYNPFPASSARTLIATSNTSAARIAAGEGILDVKVAPNPISNDVIMIKLSHEVRGDVEFQLFDLAGKEVFSRKQKSMGESEFTLKLSHPLPSGTYLLKMIINQEVYTEKVLSL